jgi:hypothetical protein
LHILHFCYFNQYKKLWKNDPTKFV